MKPPHAQAPNGPTPSYFVITGGPGAGRPSLIEGINGSALPWIDPFASAQAMLGCDPASYARFSGLTGPVFFDRGIADNVGYLRLENAAVAAAILRAARDNR
ncbi:MAG TPA: hypothetical protein VFB29_05210 [Pseudolabrys sp.]|nr:hypothetical protein [Pseudolabrys sp.]